VKLAYWGIRGLAQVPRLLLSFSGVEFEDYTYTVGDKWFKEDKLHLGLDFPNLPYLVDGEYNITESAAIQRYIIKRWGKTELLGKTIQDNAVIESFLSIFTEISSAVKGLFFNKDYEAAKGGIIEKYAPKLEQLNKFVGEKSFVLGYLTLADFVVAEDSHFIERVFPIEYKTYGFLHKIRENFSKVPEIVAYYQKPTAFKGRFYPEYAVISVETPVTVVAAESETKAWSLRTYVINLLKSIIIWNEKHILWFWIWNIFLKAWICWIQSQKKKIRNLSLQPKMATNIYFISQAYHTANIILMPIW